MGVVLSIAELSALLPLSGAIIRHAEHFVDPALSFAQGWNTVYSVMVSLPAELVAAAVIVEFWSTVSSAVCITAFGFLLICANLLFIRVYGEMEFVFASLKIMLIIGLNISKAIMFLYSLLPCSLYCGFKLCASYFSGSPQTLPF